MNIRTKLGLTSSALLITLSLVACSQKATASANPQAGAQPSTQASADPVAQATAAARNSAAVKTVDEAYAALREARAARFAIFDGSTDAAKKLIDAAVANFAMANVDSNFAAQKPKNARADQQYIPFDASMELSENFAPSPQNKAKLDEANGHISKGNYQQARETLKLANIDVTTSVAVVPAAMTKGHLEEAQRLMSEGKYYEGNLALKLIDDSILIDSSRVDAVPTKPKR
jgi:YfdX protein